MHCPFCQHEDTRVIDSRVSDDGATIRRRRVCEACGERFSTLETIELKLPLIIKSDGRREAFDARKLRSGFDRALQKRPVSEEQIEAAVRAVVHQLRMTAERELASRRVGEFVMAELRKLDHVGLRALRLGVPRVRGRGRFPRGARPPRARHAGRGPVAVARAETKRGRSDEALTQE